MTSLTKVSIAACALLVSTVHAFSPVNNAPPMSNTQLNALSFENPEDVLAKSGLPGNFGFDPLHCAGTQEQLVTYRKAEMKHSRLAMLAVMAIFWSDLHVTEALGATPFFEGRAFPEFLGAFVGLPAALELSSDRVKDTNDPNLDPFHLYPASTRGQQGLQLVEIMAGRVCMLAAAGRLAQDMLVGLGVLGEEDSLISLVVPVQATVEAMEEVVV